MQGQFPDIPGIVLAGGHSVRMGWPKALLHWPPTNVVIVRHVTDTLRDAGVSPLAVVTGRHHDRIAPALEGTGVLALHNPVFDEGQLSSLVHGLRWAFAQSASPYALATLVDVPAVRVSTVRTLLACTREGNWQAVRPAKGERHGHPVLWRRDTLALLEAADPAKGARSVMRALAAEGAVLDVEVDDEGVFRDVDTPEDYARLTNSENP